MESTYDKIVYYRFSDKEKRALLEHLKKLLKKRDNIKLVYVFGSFTRREIIRDIDIAIYAVPNLSFNEFLNLGTEIEIELGTPVDLLQLQDINPDLRLKILIYAIPVVKKDEELHNKLVSQTFSELQDQKISTRLAKSKKPTDEY
jgi:predicted nucleotidyltransferase